MTVAASGLAQDENKKPRAKVAKGNLTGRVAAKLQSKCSKPTSYSKVTGTQL